jgi:hypothetical protein
MEGRMEIVPTILWGILQNLITHWIAYLLGGAMTAGLSYWAKISENLSWPMTIVFGLIIVTCVTVLYSYGTEWGRDYVAAMTTTEEQVKEWLDVPGIKVTRENADTAETFRFLVELPDSGGSILVYQEKNRPTFILINTAILKNREAQEFFSKLKPSQAKRIREKMYLELLHSGVQYMTLGQPNNYVLIFDTIPFDKTLNKRSFIKSLFNMQTAVKAALSVLTLEQMLIYESSSLEAMKQ